MLAVGGTSKFIPFPFNSRAIHSPINSTPMSDTASSKTTALWAPNPSIEARKLKSKQDDAPWKNIAGIGGEITTCTRGKKVSLLCC